MHKPINSGSLLGDGCLIEIAWKLSGHFENTITTSDPPRCIRNSFKTCFWVFNMMYGGVPFSSGLMTTKVSRFGRERMSEMRVPYLYTGLLMSSLVTLAPKLLNRTKFCCSLSRDNSTWINLRDQGLQVDEAPTNAVEHPWFPTVVEAAKLNKWM